MCEDQKDAQLLYHYRNWSETLVPQKASRKPCQMGNITISVKNGQTQT